MNRSFKKCLEKRKIVSFPRAKSLVKKELGAAQQDLTEAKDRLQNERYKYATINAYYAAFHAARGLLYSEGLRERSHYCLAVAIEALFVETGRIEARYLRALNNLMSAREEADYGGSSTRETAILCVITAEEFVERASALLFKETRRLEK